MVKIAFKFLIIPLVALTFLSLFVEIGFEARQWLETKQAVKRNLSKTQILFIGDSILGFLSEPSSLSFQIKKILSENSPADFDFQEISAPALRTPEALDRLKAFVHQSSPHIAIVMIGKSDYLYESTPLWSPLIRLRLFRLFEAAYWDLHQKWHRVQSQLQITQQSQVQKYWDLFKEQKYSEAIPGFEESLKSGYDHERVIRALHSCYILEKEYARGIAFFTNLKKTSQHAALLDDYLIVLNRLAKNLGTGSPLEMPPTEGLALSSHVYDSRNNLRTHLWLARQDRKASLLLQTFSDAPAKISDHLNVFARNNLFEILQILKKSSTKTFLLQYPLDHLSVLRDSLPPTPENTELVDTRNILLTASSNELIDMWQDDIDHLNEKGAIYLAKKIALLIQDQRKKPQ